MGVGGMDMNQKQLSCFLEVYRCRNVQAAADKLYLTHQGLSRIIRTLEEELGHPLFVRSNRGVEPTDFATTLVPHVQRLLDDYATIQGLDSLTSQKKAVVTVYALDHLLGYLGADFVTAFHAEHPDITLSVLDTTDVTALESLSDGRSDFALVNGPIDNTRFSAATASACAATIRSRKKSRFWWRILPGRSSSARGARTTASVQASTGICSKTGSRWTSRWRRRTRN